MNVARGGYSYAVPMPEVEFDLELGMYGSPERSRATATLPGPGPAFGGGIAPPAHRPAPQTVEEMVVDLRPPGGHGGPATRDSAEEDFGLGREWGSSWKWATQGWVDTESGNPRWRPIVSTTADLSNWEPDTYLGVVTGEAGIDQAGDVRMLGDALARARNLSLESLVEAAVARGAHAVIGTGLAYTPLRNRLLVTSTGTAVTLRER